MASGVGGTSNVVVFSPGIPSSGKPIKQKVAITEYMSNIQCSGFPTSFQCPSSGTLTASLVTPALDCANLSTLAMTWSGKALITLSEGTTPIRIVFKKYVLNFVAGILYGQISGSLISVDGLEHSHETVEYKDPEDQCTRSRVHATPTSTTSTSILTLTST